MAACTKERERERRGMNKFSSNYASEGGESWRRKKKSFWRLSRDEVTRKFGIITRLWKRREKRQRRKKGVSFLLPFFLQPPVIYEDRGGGNDCWGVIARENAVEYMRESRHARLGTNGGEGGVKRLDSCSGMMAGRRRCFICRPLALLATWAFFAQCEIRQSEEMGEHPSSCPISPRAPGLETGKRRARGALFPPPPPPLPKWAADET